MKTLKIKSLKKLGKVSLFVLLLTTACAQSGNSSRSSSDSDPKNVVVQEQPTMNIHAAVIAGDLEVVKQHIKSGTNINEKDAMSGSTPLISAATFNKIEIAKALIDANAELSLKNNDGTTALHSAAFFGRIEIVQLLVDADADKTIRNNYGATARESVMGPFEDMKPIYEMMKQQLGPLGFQLNMEELAKARPVIAMMLQ